MLLRPRETIEYVRDYGARCRDCADDGPVCPGSGLPCDPLARRNAIEHVVSAINYGIEHGYLESNVKKPA